MNRTLTFALITQLAACAGPPEREPAPRVTNEVLIESTQSWDGGDFTYPKGDAQLTVARISIPRGVTLPIHCHPVPLAGVLSRGVLEVRKENGENIVVRKGEPLIEVSTQWHAGHALEDAEITVIYAGAEGVPVTVMKDGNPEWASRCR